MTAMPRKEKTPGIICQCKENNYDLVLKLDIGIESGEVMFWLLGTVTRLLAAHSAAQGNSCALTVELLLHGSTPPPDHHSLLNLTWTPHHTPKDYLLFNLPQILWVSPGSWVHWISSPKSFSQVPHLVVSIEFPDTDMAYTIPLPKMKL